MHILIYVWPSLPSDKCVNLNTIFCGLPAMLISSSCQVQDLDSIKIIMSWALRDKSKQFAATYAVKMASNVGNVRCRRRGWRPSSMAIKLLGMSNYWMPIIRVDGFLTASVSYHLGIYDDMTNDSWSRLICGSGQTFADANTQAECEKERSYSQHCGGSYASRTFHFQSS